MLLVRPTCGVCLQSGLSLRPKFLLLLLECPLVFANQVPPVQTPNVAHGGGSPLLMPPFSSSEAGGSAPAPGIKLQVPHYLSGVFTRGGFSEWFRKDFEALGPPNILDLMAAFFTYRLNYANGEDFEAVRSLTPMERSAIVVCTSIQHLLSARANFAAYEQWIAACAPQLSKFRKTRKLLPFAEWRHLI
ncbi:putative methyltransferase protein [Corchorus capsularis]|uniref:Putative methyltransferase protein n=1 Tax=Corchorus capsularis TaxID=210143 RepID=A0A1R3K250_COCAP|nr:putative methyltransferase protein [Corchorus capsularis]